MVLYVEYFPLRSDSPICFLRLMAIIKKHVTLFFAIVFERHHGCSSGSLYYSSKLLEVNTSGKLPILLSLENHLTYSKIFHVDNEYR